MRQWQNSCNKQHHWTSIISMVHSVEGQLLTHVDTSRYFTVESDKTMDMQTLGVGVLFIQERGAP